VIFSSFPASDKYSLARNLCVCVNVMRACLSKITSKVFQCRGEMGGSSSTANTFRAEQHRNYCEFIQDHVDLAFRKCVETVPKDEQLSNAPGLTREERSCVDEYTYQFAHLTRQGFMQIATLYQQMGKEMEEHARQEHVKRQAQAEARRMKE